MDKLTEKTRTKYLNLTMRANDSLQDDSDVKFAFDGQDIYIFDAEKRFGQGDVLMDIGFRNLQTLISDNNFTFEDRLKHYFSNE